MIVEGLRAGLQRRLSALQAGEFRELLGRAGFTLTKIVPTRSPVCVVEGTPA